MNTININFLKQHPQNALLPPLTSEQKAGLKELIVKHGFKIPIDIKADFTILDGHNRVAIAKTLGIDFVPFNTVRTDDDLAYMLNVNAHRRQLTPESLAYIRGRIYSEAKKDPTKNLKQFQAPTGQEVPSKTNTAELIGQVHGVDGRTVKRDARYAGAVDSLAEHHGSELKAEILSSKIDIPKHKVITMAHLQVEDQKKIIDTMRTGGAKNIDVAMNLVTRARDSQKITDMEIPEGKYATIVIDPPWDYRDVDGSDNGGLGDNFRGKPLYALMPLHEIVKLPVPDLAAENAHLYVWACNRTFALAAQLFKKWGFRFSTMLTWCKPGLGLGRTFRNNTEHVLFGIRGSLPMKRYDTGTWFMADKETHSKKPQRFYEIVETVSHAPYLEMFAREQREGWTVWGNLDENKAVG